MRGFNFEEGNFSSNVDENSKFDLILALKGGPYKKRDIKFSIKSENSSIQKKLSGKIKSPYYDEDSKHTIFRINSIRGEKNKGDFEVKVSLKSKKYGPIISAENIFIPSITVGNSFLTKDEKTNEIILELEEVFNLSDDVFSKYSRKSTPKQGEGVFTDFVSRYTKILYIF